MRAYYYNTSLWIQLAHVVTFFEGSLAHKTFACKNNIFSGTVDNWCWSRNDIFFGFSFVTICWGNFKCDHHWAFSPSSVTSCMHSLICVSTLDFAPVCGTPSTLICKLIPPFTRQILYVLRTKKNKYCTFHLIYLNVKSGWKRRKKTHDFDRYCYFKCKFLKRKYKVFFFLAYEELKKGTGWFARYSEKLRAILGNVGSRLLCVTLEINCIWSQ